KGNCPLASADGLITRSVIVPLNMIGESPLRALFSKWTLSTMTKSFRLALSGLGLLLGQSKVIFALPNGSQAGHRRELAEFVVTLKLMLKFGMATREPSPAMAKLVMLP